MADQTENLPSEDEWRALGRSGWEQRLRSFPAGDYVDPYGDGTSFYRKSSSGLELCSTPKCVEDPVGCPTGYLIFCAANVRPLFAYEADRSYLLDFDGPRASKFGKV